MITYTVDKTDLAKIEDALGEKKKKAKLVLRTAINNTAKQVVKRLPKDAAEAYYLRQGEARRTISKRNATTSSLTAMVYSTGQALELYGAKVHPKRYAPKHRPPAGHTANVKKANAPAYLTGPQEGYKAFVAKFKSGHITLAQRIPGSKNAKGREKIRTLKTLSVPSMLYQTLGGEEGLATNTSDAIQDILNREILRQIERYMK